jgi:2-hydroxychromene-2-carboxylate isomerase
MGDLIYLDRRRADRAGATPHVPPAFFFDLSCPLSYVVSEQVSWTLGDVLWVPVSFASVRGVRSEHSLHECYENEIGSPPEPEQPEIARPRERAEARARALRLPLVWPDRFPAEARRALRAAAHACEIGAGERFALAASRLAFCGGFDLDDPETLAEAAAAAGAPLDDCLNAAGDEGRDGALRATADALRSRGVTELPAFAVGRHWFEGEAGLLAACTVLRRSESYSRPLAPVG